MNSVISSNDANHMNSSNTAIDEFMYHFTVKCEFILKITLTWIQITSEFTWLIEYCTKKDNRWIHILKKWFHFSDEFIDSLNSFNFVDSNEFIYSMNSWIHWIHLHTGNIKWYYSYRQWHRRKAHFQYTKEEIWILAVQNSGAKLSRN